MNTHATCSRLWRPSLIGVIALTVYVLTLAPDITWAHASADGGDLITASFRGGAAHPPGYPLYALLGRLAAAIPVGSIPFRYNLFSALAMSMATAVIAWTIQERAASAAFLAALGFAFAPLVWAQAVVAEVYGLSALLAAWVVASSLRPEPRSLELGLALGLGVAHHPTLAAFAPLALDACARQTRKYGVRHVSARFAVGLALGLVPLAYLPLTARSAVGWGDPGTLEGLGWLISGGLYRGNVFALSPALIGPRLAQMARWLFDSFTWIGVAAALGGLVALCEHDLRRGLACLFALFALAAFAVGYATSDSQVYLIPAWVVLAVAIGWGWRKLRDGLTRLTVSYRAVLSGLLLALALALPAFTLVRNWAAQDLSVDHAARDWINTVLAEAPERAMVVTAEDAHTFALWVGTLVERKRQDLVVIDQDLLGYDWYRARLGRGFAGLNISGSITSVDDLSRLNPHRPVCRLADGSSAQLLCEAK